MATLNTLNAAFGFFTTRLRNARGGDLSGRNEGDKTVVLDNPAAQAMYHASLLFAELGGQQAEMACCPIPPPPGACPYSPPPPLP